MEEPLATALRLGRRAQGVTLREIAAERGSERSGPFAATVSKGERLKILFPFERSNGEKAWKSAVKPSSTAVTVSRESLRGLSEILTGASKTLDQMAAEDK